MPPSQSTRSNSGSTIRRDHLSNGLLSTSPTALGSELTASLAIHNEVSSSEAILFSPALFVQTPFQEGDLVTLALLDSSSSVHDFATTPNVQHSRENIHLRHKAKEAATKFVCKIKFVPPELTQKLRIQDVSINKQVADLFGFASSKTVTISPAHEEQHGSTHVEICFRDAYLSRADMWRFANQELLGRAVFLGQKLSFLGSMKAVVRDIHVQGRRARSAFFSNKTVPVFRSEAARYVIFIQMSREMWDFDSEGDGEIMLDRKSVV